jgi:excisionase family DNA binding protein
MNTTGPSENTVAQINSAPTPPQESRDLTPQEVADRLGVVPRTVRDLIADGHLTAYRVGTRLLRIRPEDLEAFRAGR